MRDLIATEKGEGDGWDLKLARGGLTDLDFIAQALVLAHAHAHPDLVGLPTLSLLSQAGEVGLIGPQAAATLVEADRVLSDVQHWQRLTLGGQLEEGHRPLAMQRLAAIAGAPDPALLRSWLDELRGRVEGLFDELLRQHSMVAPAGHPAA
jgi:glutamate-ammonia-ligase adenylyltransferase